MSDPAQFMEFMQSPEGQSGMTFTEYQNLKKQQQALPASAPSMAGVRQTALPPGMLSPEAGYSQNMYGVMPVPQPMMDILNARFGWNPQGVGKGRAMTAQNNYYAPPTVYPDVMLPPITGG